MIDSTNELSQHINVTAKATFLPEHSVLAEHKFVFSYTITISNNSDQSVQLMSRAWKITDADGQVTNVEGKGVIGVQPKILPNTSYTYTSGSVFNTPIGTMQGHYIMQDSHQHSFIVEIPVFRLALPNILN